MKAKTRVSRPITDSSLAVPPQFWRDGGRSQQEWVDATEKFRTIRGNIIADAYDIENKLGRLLTEIFYPTIPWHPSHDADVYHSHYQLRPVFSTTFIETSRFHDKIRILRSSVSEIPYLRDACSPNLLDHLNELRDTRNRFAHDPIQFEFTDPPNPEIRAMLVGRDRSEAITSEYVLAKWELSNDCSTELGNLLRAMEARFDKFQHKNHEI